MHIRELRVRNLKLVRELDLSFVNADGTPRMWTVLVGENGLCKTALLQAIALAAAGHERGNQLADVRSLRDRRQSDADTKIDATFGFSKDRHSLRTYPGLTKRPKSPPRLESHLLIKPGSNVLEATSSYAAAPAARKNGSDALPAKSLNPLSLARGQNVRLADGTERPLADWFVVAYGVGRALWPPMSSAESFDAMLARFKPLFDAAHHILGVRFADVFGASEARAYSKALEKCLVQGRILPRVTKVELAGRGGIHNAETFLYKHRFQWEKKFNIPAVWLSQGYQATIAWVADLIGHAFWEAQESFKIQELEGLVLIDELDLHLHPRWQVDLVPRLRQVFPRLQFVVTTHSPMLLPGFKSDEIIYLTENAAGDVSRKAVSRSPRLMTGSELYHYFFDIEQLYPSDLGQALQRYGYLAANPRRSVGEEREVKKLRTKLGEAGVRIGFEPVQREPPA